MKKSICYLLVIVMMVSICAMPGYASGGGPYIVIQTAAPNEGEKQSDEAESAALDFNSLEGLKVERVDGEVILTLPAAMAGEDVTEKTIEKDVEDSGFISGTLNEDGSVTYVMSEEAHEEFMEDYKKQLDESFAELIGSEQAPSIVAIEVNDDYTEFSVTLNAEEVGFGESFAALTLYMAAGMYHLFNGTEPENVSVKYLSEATGEVIEETNSSDIAQ